MSRTAAAVSRTPSLLAATCLALLGLNTAQADDAAAIARIEAGLRPAVALTTAPVVGERLQAAMARLKVPGVSVAVIRGGKLAWARGYGVAWQGGPAVTPETLFQAASISKPVAAMAALRLAEQGKLPLDAPVDTLLTSWKLPAGAGKPTVRQLLSHTGGTTVSGFPGYPAGTPLPSLVQVLDGTPMANTKAVVVDIAPGSAFRYSGGGYTVLQQAMIDRSSMPFEALLQQSVLAPLGMRDSTFAQPLPAALANRAARPHDREGTPVPGGAHTYPEQAAAGLWTTPQDLARFAIAIQQGAAGSDKGVLTAAMTRTMLTPVIGSYALGLETREGRKFFGHNGANRGFRALMTVAVAGGDGAVVLTNADSGSELAADLVRAIAREYKWDGNQTRLRTPVDFTPAARKELPGTYRIEGIGEFEIAEREGRMMVALRPGDWEPLYAESEQVLFVLSRNVDIRRSDADSGHSVMGASARPYRRIKGE